MSRSSGKNPLIISVAVFILLEVVSLCILGNNSSAQQSWLGRGFINVKAGMWGLTDGVVSYFNLKKENDSLAHENFELIRKLEGMRIAQADSSAKWVPLRCHYDFIQANIVTMTCGSQHNYLIIDRGRDDGVEIDDGIITPCGVVGIVQSVTDRYAYALSYANTNVVISAKPGKDGSVGSLRWSGKGTRNSLLEGIPLHCPAELGDTVYTSGYSSMFPPDIPLGVITERNTKGGSSAILEVRLMEDFSSLHHVIVVRNTDKEQIDSLTDEQ